MALADLSNRLACLATWGVDPVRSFDIDVCGPHVHPLARGAASAPLALVWSADDVPIYCEIVHCSPSDR